MLNRIKDFFCPARIQVRGLNMALEQKCEQLNEAKAEISALRTEIEERLKVLDGAWTQVYDHRVRNGHDPMKPETTNMQILEIQPKRAVFHTIPDIHKMGIEDQINFIDKAAKDLCSRLDEDIRQALMDGLTRVKRNA